MNTPHKESGRQTRHTWPWAAAVLAVLVTMGACTSETVDKAEEIPCPKRTTFKALQDEPADLPTETAVSLRVCDSTLRSLAPERAVRSEAAEEFVALIRAKRRPADEEGPVCPDVAGPTAVVQVLFEDGEARLVTLEKATEGCDTISVGGKEWGPGANQAITQLRAVFTGSQ